MIYAKYECVDGWHTFVSDELPGLYVTHKDLKVAFEDVGPSIALLMRLDHGIECNVSPELLLSELLGAVKDHRFALTVTVR